MKDPQPLAADVRATSEYQAAWDLEVWKAEEKAKFERRLEKERIEVGKRLDKELFAREQERADAFEKQKQQVAKLSQRVGKTLEALQKREEQVAAREAELQRKKSALLLDFEKKTREAEDKVGRTSQEAYFKIEALGAEKKELQAEADILRGRVDRLQREHDRVCTDFSDYKKEHLLGGETTQLMVELNGLKEEKKRWVGEKESLEASLAATKEVAQKHKNQVKKLAADYNKLLAVSHRIQMEALEVDKANLRRAQALQDASALRTVNLDLRFQEQQAALHGRGPEAGLGVPVPLTAAASPHPSSSATQASTPGAGLGAVSAGPLKSSEELKSLLEHAEQVECAAAAAARDARCSRREKEERRARRHRRQASASRRRRSPDHTLPESHTPGSHDDRSSDHASSAGRPAEAAETPEEALMSLRRVAANRKRLLATGVMQPDDEYIKQLAETVAAKCAELGISEADIGLE
eukprot:TRINITY_DN15348_c0_g1_i1.p1 TRINITY_DN15348_c0_g1~~TRINITY_DN15348_c0_g1_i1.p1  ORF type:complete len:468 (+),score=194.86 TRINITY_DN15348_c0_g1_i1:108-1511(+)